VQACCYRSKLSTWPDAPLSGPQAFHSIDNIEQRGQGPAVTADGLKSAQDEDS